VNILLITPLYPGYINQSKIDVTYAVHNIAKEWTNKNEYLLQNRNGQSCKKNSPVLQL